MFVGPVHSYRATNQDASPRSPLRPQQREKEREKERERERELMLCATSLYFKYSTRGG